MQKYNFPLTSPTFFSYFNARLRKSKTIQNKLVYFVSTQFRAYPEILKTYRKVFYSSIEFFIGMAE